MSYGRDRRDVQFHTQLHGHFLIMIRIIVKALVRVSHIMFSVPLSMLMMLAICLFFSTLSVVIIVDFPKCHRHIQHPKSVVSLAFCLHIHMIPGQICSPWLSDRTKIVCNMLCTRIKINRSKEYKREF